MEAFKHAGRMYKIERMISNGSFGKSFIYSNKGNKFFLRSFSDDQLQDDQIRAKLTNEKNVADLKLKNPLVSTALSFIQQPGLNGILYDYLGHGTLEDFVTINGPQSENVCKILMSQLLEGLDFLVENNIVHRNIQPSSIFMVKGMNSISIKIGKFESSQILTIDDSFETEDYVGPWYFSAPEIIRRQPYDCKADVWSAGCVLIFISSGRKPFKSTDFSGEDISNEIRIVERIHQKILKKIFIVNSDDRPCCEDLLKLSYFVIKNVDQLTINTPKSVLSVGQFEEEKLLDKAFILEESKNDLKRKLFDNSESESESSPPKRKRKGKFR